MEHTLKRLIGKGVDVFVDDVVVHAPTFELLLERLDETLKCLQEAGLTANVKKCKLFKNDVQLLGHIVSADGFRPVQSKCEAIQKWPVPTSKRKLREFLGTASYYRKFIQEFSQIAAPLSKLTSAKERWEWSFVQSDAFNKLKEKLTQPPVLTYFTPGYPIIVDTDASATAVGAVLSQVYPEGEKVIAYHSKCLSAPERNYCVTRRELLAILEALRVWRHYLHGAKFIVRTDHSSLTWLQSFKEPEGQLARWLERLSLFDMELQYRRGAASTNADGLSRRPCPKDCKYCLRRETKLQNRYRCQLQWQWQRPLDISRPVLVFDPVVPKGYSPKLASLWKGPYDIVRKISDLLYEIHFPQKKTKILHRSHLYQPTHLLSVHH
jgi:hypothetical protein